jgi:hypothetical protein
MELETLKNRLATLEGRTNTNLVSLNSTNLVLLNSTKLEIDYTT